MFNLDGTNKCLKHDCAISAYDPKKKQLLCAACLTEIIKTQTAS